MGGADDSMRSSSRQHGAPPDTGRRIQTAASAHQTVKSESLGDFMNRSLPPAVRRMVLACALLAATLVALLPETPDVRAAGVAHTVFLAQNAAQSARDAAREAAQAAKDAAR